MSYRKVKKGNMRKKNQRQKNAVSQRNGVGGTGKKILLVIAVLFVISSSVSAITGIIFCPSRWKCKEVISNFQVACNELEINDILNCLKPSVSNPLKVALGVGSIVTSQSSDEMLEGIFDALGEGFGGIREKTGLSIEGLFRTMEIKPRSFGFPRKTRKVKCKATVGGIEQWIYIYVIKQYGEPYISKISFIR